LLHLERLLEDVEAVDLRAALRRRQEAGEDLHRRRLAGAVGPEEAEDLALLDGEVEVGDGDAVPVPLRQVLDFDHRHLNAPPPGFEKTRANIGSLRSRSTWNTRAARALSCASGTAGAV